MKIKEKMEILGNSVQYAIEDGMGCLDCLKFPPPGYISRGGGGYISCYSPTRQQVDSIIDAIHKIGLTTEEVDRYMLENKAVEGGGGTEFSGRFIGGCISPKGFLKFMEKLLILKDK